VSARRKGTITILLAIVIVIAAASLSACGDTASDETTMSTAGSTASTAGDTAASEAVSEATGNSVETAAGAAGQDTGETDPAAGLSPGDQDDAVDIARAYFVAKTDFTGDQFDWKLEAAAKDNEGRWWVRVSATPKDDTSSDTVQIYVKRPPDMELWVAHGMSPEIDPATDKNMPDEVRDRL
jgi:hypothetical protein